MFVAVNPAVVELVELAQIVRRDVLLGFSAADLDAFLHRFATTLDKTGFGVIENDYRQGEGVMQRNDTHITLPGNYCKTRIQDITWTQDRFTVERFGYDHVRIVSEQHVLVAHKK